MQERQRPPSVLYVPRANSRLINCREGRDGVKGVIGFVRSLSADLRGLGVGAGEVHYPFVDGVQQL